MIEFGDVTSSEESQLEELRVWNLKNGKAVSENNGVTGWWIGSRGCVIWPLSGGVPEDEICCDSSTLQG